MKLSNGHLEQFRTLLSWSDETLSSYMGSKTQTLQQWIASSRKIARILPEDYEDERYLRIKVDTIRRIMFSRQHSIPIKVIDRELHFDDENEMLYRLTWDGVK